MGEQQRLIDIRHVSKLHPSAAHFISNPGKRNAKFLWVSTPPNF